jgi:hypothetical protein
METKAYPENYPSDALDILNAMSFTDGKAVKILGSMSIRSQQYAGDYDAFELVKKTGSKERVLKELASKFQEIIKSLVRMPNVAIGDIKAGSIEEWRVIPKNAGVVNGSVVGYSAAESRAKISELFKAEVITPQEAKYSLQLLKPNLSPAEFLNARKDTRFNIIRWSVPEVLAGHKTLRDGRKYTLEEAFYSPTITKLDVIGFVQNNKYTDFSIIYEFECDGKVLNPDDIEIEKSLKEDIIYYTAEGNPFKALKRTFALAKFKHDEKLIEKLIPILNSDLGRLYSLSSDIGTLITLLEEKHRDADMKKVRFEIDQFKARLGNIYEVKHFGSDEHKMIGYINSALKTTNRQQLIHQLNEIQTILEKNLAYNTPKAK